MNLADDVPGISDPTEIGAGGYGRVYRAYQSAFGRTVAVKVLIGRFDDDATQRRFERECHTIGAVSGHPNIVAVYDAGTSPHGHPYIVMPFLQHGSLASRINGRGPLPWAQVVVIGIKLAGALEAAHRVGVLHRDVKPENVLVSDYGEPLLADFGIALQAGLAAAATATAAALTPAHGAPELLSGKTASPASDIYSLASTLHNLVTGVPPFHREGEDSILPLLHRTANEQAPDLRQLGVAVPVARVIDQAMAKDPRDRPSSARRFGQMLQAAQQELGLPVTPLPVEEVDTGSDDSAALPGPLSLTPLTGDQFLPSSRSVPTPAVPPPTATPPTATPPTLTPPPATPNPSQHSTGPTPGAPAAQNWTPSHSQPGPNQSGPHTAPLMPNRPAHQQMSSPTYPPQPNGPQPNRPHAGSRPPRKRASSTGLRIVAVLAALCAMVLVVGLGMLLAPVLYGGGGSKPTTGTPSGTGSQTAGGSGVQQLSSVLLPASEYGSDFELSSNPVVPLDTLYCGKPIGLDNVETAFGSVQRSEPLTAIYQQVWRTDQATAKFGEVVASGQGCSTWNEEELTFTFNALQPPADLGADSAAYNAKVTGVPGLDELYLVQVWTVDNNVLNSLTIATLTAPEGADLEYVYSTARKSRERVRSNS